MKRTFGLAAGAFLFAVGCGAEAAEPSPARTPFDKLGQEVEADHPVSFITGPTSGKLDGVAFTATLSVNEFVAEEGTVYALGALSAVTGLSAEAAAKLEGSEVKLPLSVQPEGGFPTDGTPPSCDVLGLFIAPTELPSEAGALSLDRTELDISATPGGGAVVAQIVCGVPDLLESGGALAGIQGDFTTLIIILNGLVGPAAQGRDPEPAVEASPVEEPTTGPSIETSPREQL